MIKRGAGSVGHAHDGAHALYFGTKAGDHGLVCIAQNFSSLFDRRLQIGGLSGYAWGGGFLGALEKSDAFCTAFIDHLELSRVAFDPQIVTQQAAARASHSIKSV